MPEPIEITKMKENAEDREYVLKTVKENGKLSCTKIAKPSSINPSKQE